MAKNIITAVEELATDVCVKNGAYLYDAEYQKEGKNQVLRVYVEKDGGIGIDECETISRMLSEELDRLNLIQTAYNLEVSSPGVERKLTKDWHFEKVIGKQIELSLYAPLNGVKTLLGVLEALENQIIHITVGNELLKIPSDKVASAKLYFDIAEALKGK
ncbi:MAG: ribosome maturation factor RimP [Clostridia bacterium]|nr:ribosome maturation factor RimP [Clostridia bacterium]